MIAYVAELVAQPAAADAVESLLKDLVRATAAEPGARIYAAHRLEADPCRFLVYEAYADQASADAHMQGGPVQTALTAFGKLLAEPADLRSLRVLDGFTRPLEGNACGTQQ